MKLFILDYNKRIAHSHFYFLLLSLLFNIHNVHSQSRELRHIKKVVTNLAVKSNLPTIDVNVWSPVDSIRFNYTNPQLKRIDSYRIGSATKMLSAILVLHYVSTGALQLESPVSNYVKLPSSMQGLAIKDLLNHQSGISDYTRNKKWMEKVSSGNPPTTFEDRFELIDTAIVSEKQFYYSNSNYLLLEKVIEAVSAKSYLTAFNDFYASKGFSGIFLDEQADTNQAFFAQTAAASSDVTAVQEVYGYAGDATATSTDLVRLMKELFINKSILDLSSLEKMQSWIPMTPMTIPIGDHGVIDYYGFGLMQLTYKGNTWLGHSGGTLKYQSFIFMQPNTSIIVIALTNGSGQHYNNTFVQSIVPAILEDAQKL